MTEQLSLPFGHRFNEQRAMLARAIQIAGLGAHAEVWLFYVHDVSRDEVLRRSYPAIADRLKCCRRTAIRIVKACEEAGLLAVDEQRYASGGQRENGYAINWEGVKVLTCRTPPSSVERVTTPCKFVTTPCKFVTPYKEKYPLGYPSEPPPTPSHQDPWGQARRRFSEIGLIDIPGAIRAAEQRNETPDSVMSMIDLWESRPGCWGVAGLYSRIVRGTWPEASAEWVAAERERAMREERERSAARLAHQRAQAESDGMEVEQLERSRGASLDALEPDEYLALVESAIDDDFSRSLAVADRRNALLRPALLAAMGGRGP